MAHRLPHCPLGVGSQPFVQLQLAEGDHGPDGKALLRLLNGVQPQAGKIGGGADVDVFHLEPDHAAQHPVGLFLVELPGFLQAFCFFVFSDG